MNLLMLTTLLITLHLNECYFRVGKRNMQPNANGLKRALFRKYHYTTAQLESSTNSPFKQASTYSEHIKILRNMKLYKDMSHQGQFDAGLERKILLKFFLKNHFLVKNIGELFHAYRLFRNSRQL